jgi:DNA-binding HxlR family transcriptional regulator
MDEETASLIDALRHPGAALLLGLLESEATEDELRCQAPGLSQSAINRKLAQLAEKRLIYRESGSRQQKGLLWGIVFREETEACLSAANLLARVGVERRQAQVAATQQRLARARAERRLREAKAS